ncbi:MAG: hypothetical protein MJ152_05005 [Clostridia bacterium]|nr:hypothetical protein [Clostridia bacterium]
MKNFVSCMAYFAIGIIAVALALGKLFGWLINPNILYVLTLIAEVIAYVITAVIGYSFAKSKRSVGWKIAYFIFIVVIAVFVVINTIAQFKA